MIKIAGFNTITSTYSLLKKTNAAILQRPDVLQEANKEKAKIKQTLISTVFDKTKTDEEIKQGVRKLIVDKITDGTKVNDNDRIDIVECAWIAYRLNRESGRSRVISWILATAVLIDSLGLVLFGKKNKLRELTRTIIRMTKRPVWYALGVYITRTFMMFIPEMIILIGSIFHINSLSNLGTFLKQSGGNIWTVFNSVHPIKSVVNNYDTSILQNLGVSAGQFVVGSALVWFGRQILHLFYLLYAVYTMMFTSIRGRKTKVSKQEINQSTVLGLESYIRSKNKYTNFLEGATDISNKAKLTISVVSKGCIYSLMKDISNKSNTSAPINESTFIINQRTRLSEILGLGALAAGSGFLATNLLKGMSHLVVFCVKYVLKLCLSIAKNILMCLDGVLIGLAELIGLWYRSIKYNVKNAIKNMLSSSSEEDLIRKDKELNKKIVKISKDKTFKGKVKADTIVNKIDSKVTSL